MVEGQRYKHDRGPKSEKFICQSGDLDIFFEPVSADKTHGYITVRKGADGQTEMLSEIYLRRDNLTSPWKYTRHKHWTGSLDRGATGLTVMEQAIEAFNAAFHEAFAAPGTVTLGDALDRLPI